MRTALATNCLIAGAGLLMAVVGHPWLCHADARRLIAQERYGPLADSLSPEEWRSLDEPATKRAKELGLAADSGRVAWWVLTAVGVGNAVSLARTIHRYRRLT